MEKNIHIARAAKLGCDTSVMEWLLKHGYSVAQAWGPDWDEDGNEIVYRNDAGPVENPDLVMYVEFPGKLSAYVSAKDAAAWLELKKTHPDRVAAE